MKNNGLYYKHATDTINSEDFWENYFRENKAKKPNKIIYYKEQNPTLALHNFKQKHRLHSSTVRPYTEKADILSSHKIQRGDERAMLGIHNFKPLALEVIDEYFDRKL